MSQEDSQHDYENLCKTLKQLVPDEVGKETWYLIAAAILTSSPEYTLLAGFYTHLTTHDPDFASEDAQARLSLRLRDVLLKLVGLIGAPHVLCALIPLAKAEGAPEDRSKTSTLSEKWKSLDPPTIHARGTSTIDSIYGPTLLPRIFASFGAHSQDIQFMELFTVYGLYLSDHSALTPLETEAVVFATITVTGYRGPSLWHMRGLGRLLGARGTEEMNERMSRIKDVLRGVKVACVTVVEFCGAGMVGRSGLEKEGDGGWVNVGDVVRELGGWGDDPFP